MDDSADEKAMAPSNIQLLLNQQSVSLLEAQSKFHQQANDIRNLSEKLEKLSEQSKHQTMSFEEPSSKSIEDIYALNSKMEKAISSINNIYRKLETFATRDEIIDLKAKYSSLCSKLKGEQESTKREISFSSNPGNESMSKMNSKIEQMTKTMVDYQSKLNDIYDGIQSSKKNSPSVTFNIPKQIEDTKPTAQDTFNKIKSHDSNSPEFRINTDAKSKQGTFTSVNTPPNHDEFMFDSLKKNPNDSIAFSNIMAMLKSNGQTKKSSFLRSKANTKLRDNSNDVSGKITEMKNKFFK